MNKETKEELAAAEQVKRALQNSMTGIGLYGAETIEKLIARIRCQDRKIERYEKTEEEKRFYSGKHECFKKIKEENEK